MIPPPGGGIVVNIPAAPGHLAQASCRRPPHNTDTAKHGRYPPARGIALSGPVRLDQQADSRQHRYCDQESQQKIEIVSATLLRFQA